jgi:AcrR family transcriptional regulator
VTTLEERRALRLGRLLRAGVELLGAPGGPAVTVRAVCARAGLTERYFYEGFGDRDGFVRTVYESVAGSAHAALTAAVTGVESADERAQRAVRAFVELIVDDPPMGHVLLVSPMVDPALTSLGTDTLPVFVAQVAAELPVDVDDAQRQLTATGLVGALTALFTAYLRGALRADREQLVEHCVSVIRSSVAPPRTASRA